MARGERLVVSAEVAAALRRGRLWVYREGVRSRPGTTAGVVDVVDERGAFLGRGVYDAAASVAVRIFTRDEGQSLDQRFFRARIEAAIALRRRLLDLSSCDAIRLVHAEGDGLPGIALDQFADSAVVWTWTSALCPLLPALTAALRDTASAMDWKLERIALRSLARDGGTVEPWLWGTAPSGEIVVREGALRFSVDLNPGRAVGLFLDQRDTRARVQRLATGARVLNLFAFTGSFSVAAAAGGASRVVSVDLSRAALKRAERNFALNGQDGDLHETVVGDAFEALPRLRGAGRRFDLVVVDPPAFATRGKGVFRTVQDYERLISLALEALEPAGLLLACSPVASFSLDQLERVLASAATRAGTSLRIFAEGDLPADFPIHPAWPEGRFRKAVFCARAEG